MFQYLLRAKSKKFKNDYDTVPTLKLSGGGDEDISAKSTN